LSATTSFFFCVNGETAPRLRLVPTLGVGSGDVKIVVLFYGYKDFNGRFLNKV